MRGRDHGLPGYNTVRRANNLQPVANWSDINPELYATNPEVWMEAGRERIDDVRFGS